GDSNVGVVRAGQQPLYAALQPNSSRVFVSNSDGSITSFTPASILSSIGAPSTITLPAGLVPGFLFSTESGTMYAATTGTDTTDCPTAPNTGAIVTINASSLAIENVICVHPTPTVLAETSDGRKLYSVNSDGTVSSINVADKSVNAAISCATCSTSLNSPVWAVASLDSSKIFILDQTGIVWVIDTFTDQPSVPGSQTASPSNFMALDSRHNRLYITSSAVPATVRILDASSAALSSVIAAPLTLPSGTTPVMVSFPPAGTAAYVLSANGASPVVSVISTSSNTILSTINLPSATANPSAIAACQATGVHPFTMAASGNSARLYVTNCYSSSTDIIDTSTNRRILTMNSPTSAYPPAVSSNFPPPQNPVFVVAGP
ncbi:MAG TPA: hypothetical protein VMT53_19000, partial [Terriglobales bacterium]|nr:hypothetical protein [Terriglobales bacterium]